MFDKLKKHHLGFVIPIEKKKHIEDKFGSKFTYDTVQETHVLFVYDKDLRIYIEYICQEGRVAKQKPGFVHICYSVEDQSELRKVENYIGKNKTGYKLTELEKSCSRECGYVVFYFIKNLGVVELNIVKME
ncbi:MAG: VOC family protein [Candidatus Brocadiaceae bacterium]|nr:VOC family protein [Candidatus Brocadiaceae bacterium]